MVSSSKYVLACVVALSTAAENPRGIIVDNAVIEMRAVASDLSLDVGKDRALAGWLTRGTHKQLENKAIAAGIVRHCIIVSRDELGEIPDSVLDHPSLAEAAQRSYDAAFMAAWHMCQGNEVAAYKRTIIEGEFHGIDPAVIHRCSTIPDADSFVAVESCVREEARQ
jgi:hypothetical protein